MTKSQSEIAMIKREPEEPAQEGACGQPILREVRKQQSKGERIKVLTAHRPRSQMTWERDTERAGEQSGSKYPRTNNDVLESGRNDHKNRSYYPTKYWEGQTQSEGI